MVQARPGSTVKVHYTGTLDDGTVFDSSVSREPLEFTIGAGQVIPGFERAVVGLEPGDSTTTRLAPDEAYGQRQDNMLIEVSPEQFPDGIEPEVGQQLQVRNQSGNLAVVTVAEIKEESVTLDGNHPLAGKELNFTIELVEVS